MKKIIILVVAILILGFFWFKGKDTVAPASPLGGPAPAEGTLTTLPAPSDTTVVAKEFTVLGSNFTFTPNTIEVKQGDTVKITFQSASGFHDLTLDEFRVATKQLKAGESETVQFVADKVGSFEYYCSVGNHRAMGMKGTLTVK
ncbi:MAG: cupredoxin domain-containing protein [Candidatus Vogelbacteria bacterium]